MSDAIAVGDPVRVHFDDKFGERQGWYAGRVSRIEPYSEHRRFYWVELDQAAREALGISEISVFNVRNIQKIPADAGDS